MSKSELINSASADENNGIEEIKLQMMNTCLTLQSCNHTCTNHVFQKCPKENCPGKFRKRH